MRFEIRVRPNASAAGVGGTHDGALLVRVTASPEGGRATAAALRALADALGVPPRSVRLVRGATTRRKLIEVASEDGPGPTLEDRIARLRGLTAS